MSWGHKCDKMIAETQLSGLWLLQTEIMVTL